MSAAQEAMEWHIPCVDIAGRSRTLLLTVDESYVVLTAPPGESARVRWAHSEELSRLLHTLSGMALTGSSFDPPVRR